MGSFFSINIHMSGLKRILPNINPRDFDSILNSIGVKRFEVLGDDRIVLDYDRYNNKQMLQTLNESLKSHGTVFRDRRGDVPFIEIPKTNSRIYTKAKKGTSNILMKPQLFGSRKKLTKREIPYRNYSEEVVQSILETGKLNSHQKEVLIGLIRSINNNISSTEMRKLIMSLGKSISLSTLNNDFGEVLGPIAILENQMLPIHKASALVYIPGKGNEPLLDYKIIDKNRVYKISAKSGPTTNTLKPGHIRSLIDDEDYLLNKHKRTHQYQLLRILDEHSIRHGPIEAVKFLRERGYSGLDWVDPRTIAYSEEIRQRAENDIMRISKDQLDFTDIFFDAILSKLFYIKFRIKGNGTMMWKLVHDKRPTPGPGPMTRILFRSKNSIGVAKSKLGLQP